MAKTLTLEIERITVLTGKCGEDRVCIYPKNVTSGYPNMRYKPVMEFHTQKGFGPEWVRITFGSEPDEVVNV